VFPIELATDVFMAWQQHFTFVREEDFDIVSPLSDEFTSFFNLNWIDISIEGLFQ